MNKSTISDRPRRSVSVVLFLASTVLLLLAATYLWRAHMESKDQLNELSVQNSRLQEELAAAKAEIDDLSSGDSSRSTRERLAELRESTPIPPPKEAVETLFLKDPTVQQTDAGLKVALEFQLGEGIDLPEQITLVVRIPSSSAARIHSFDAASSDLGSGSIVNASGKLAMIQCTPSELGGLAFDLTVTEPVKAQVRGSDGILDFELEITPNGCTVRKL
jgi:hypothetical protein